MDKKSFVIYENWAEVIKRLPTEEAGELIKAICDYKTGTEYKIENPYMSAYFEGQIKPQLGVDDEKYQKKCERIAELNRKRKEQYRHEIETKSSRNRYEVVSDNDNDTVNDTDNDTDNVNVNDTDNDTVSPSEININKKSIPRKKSADPRHPFGEYNHVRLSDKEYQKLLSEYGTEKAEAAIKYLDEYIEYKGYKCKNYYLAMKKWVFDALEEKKKSEPADDYLLKVIRGEA